MHSIYDQHRAEEKLSYQEKVQQTLEMYNAGVSLRAIGLHLGYKPKAALTSARRLLMRGLEQAVCLDAERMRVQEGMRLDALLSILWPKALELDLGVIDRILPILAMKHKLYGLYQSGEGTNAPKQLVQQAVIILPPNQREGDAAIPVTAKTEPLLIESR